jgi:hypothetical protein
VLHMSKQPHLAYVDNADKTILLNKSLTPHGVGLWCVGPLLSFPSLAPSLISFIHQILYGELAYIQTALFEDNMKQQITDQLFKLPHITIILSVLLLVGCATRTITAPDLLHPVSMSPKVGVNPNQKYQEVAKFSRWILREKNRRTDIQEQMSEVLKGPKRKAIKDMEIFIDKGEFIFLIVGGPGRGFFRVKAEGSVIEIQ